MRRSASSSGDGVRTDGPRVIMQMRNPGSVSCALAASLLRRSRCRAFAKEIEGVRFADQIRAGGAVLRLNDVGLMRYRYVIKAYVAALYLGDGARATDVLADAAEATRDRVLLRHQSGRLRERDHRRHSRQRFGRTS